MEYPASGCCWKPKIRVTKDRRMARQSEKHGHLLFFVFESTISGKGKRQITTSYNVLMQDDANDIVRHHLWYIQAT